MSQESRALPLLNSPGRPSVAKAQGTGAARFPEAHSGSPAHGDLVQMSSGPLCRHRAGAAAVQPRAAAQLCQAPGARAPVPNTPRSLAPPCACGEGCPLRGVRWLQRAVPLPLAAWPSSSGRLVPQRNCRANTITLTPKHTHSRERPGCGAAGRGCGHPGSQSRCSSVPAQ